MVSKAASHPAQTLLQLSSLAAAACVNDAAWWTLQRRSARFMWAAKKQERTHDAMAAGGDAAAAADVPQQARVCPPCSELSAPARQFMLDNAGASWETVDLSPDGVAALRSETTAFAAPGCARVCRELGVTTVDGNGDSGDCRSGGSGGAGLPPTLGGVPVQWVVPAHVRGPEVVLYFFGGGFVTGCPEDDLSMTARLAHRLGRRVVVPRYRLAPEHPFPAARDDALRVYAALAAATAGARSTAAAAAAAAATSCSPQTASIAAASSSAATSSTTTTATSSCSPCSSSPSFPCSSAGPPGIIVVGQSAGGNLALGVVLSVIQQSSVLQRAVSARTPSSSSSSGPPALPAPLAVALLSPWIDLTHSGDSHSTLDNLDPTLSVPHFLLQAARAYTGASQGGGGGGGADSGGGSGGGTCKGGGHGEDAEEEAATAEKPDSASHDAAAASSGVSPLFAAWDELPRGCFPPTVISTGTRDVLLSDCVRLAARLRRLGSNHSAGGRGWRGGRVELRVAEGMWHVFEWDPDLPESVESLEAIADFLEASLPPPVAAANV